MPSDISRRSGRDILRICVSGRMLTALLMGFSSGLPLLLATGSVLQAWLKEAGVDLGAIGLFALVGLPYTLNFCGRRCSTALHQLPAWAGGAAGCC
jgi:PAT family beta-lactamase induction signal transducer AmpG